MKIEKTENYTVVSAEEGKFIYNKSEENPTMVQQILMPISTTEETIKQTYKEIEKDTIFQTSKKYSKLLLIRNLKAENLWDYIKNFIIENGLKDQWDACTYITESDTMFQAMLNLLKVNHTQIFIDQILNKSIY